MYGFARSRRVNPLNQPDAPYVGYDGPDFMQQTNFTGMIQANVVLTDIAAETQLGDTLNVAELVLRPGDVLEVEGCIRMEATHLVDNTTYTVKFKNGTGTGFTISSENIATGVAYLLRFRITMTIDAGGNIKVQHCDFAETIPSYFGGMTNVTNAVGEEPDEMFLTVTANRAENKTTLQWLSATRIRQGLP